jgi:hypothetical protein
MLKPVTFWGSVALLTGLGYFVFPGHTYLQADTQIYVPMMERIYNPVLFSADPMVTRPHLALTAFDEIAIALRNYLGLDFEHGLKLQQLVFRACAAAGLLLIAMHLGLPPAGSFFVASAVILNAQTLGMGITELDPVARSFAFGLLLLAVGLATEGRSLAAGIAAAVGFLIHPTTMAPFLAVAVFVVLRRAARPIVLAPLLPAAVVLLLLMHFQAGGAEQLDFFRRVDSFQEGLQRQYMAWSFVSQWDTKRVLDCLSECAVVVAGFWRVRGRLRPPLRDWLWGFAAIAVLSIPFSWIVLDQLRLAPAGPWDPLRTLVFITLLASLLSAANGIFAAQEGRWWEAPLWFAIALALPVKTLLFTWFVNPWLIVLVLALAAAATAAGLLARSSRGAAWVAAGVFPFVAFSASGLAPPPRPADSPEVRQLAAWAQAATDETAVFLFADDGHFGGSGPFRARALRSIYVDYEGVALVNYFPEFAVLWAQRWRDTREGHWLIGAGDFQQLADRHIDFVVLRKEHAIPAKQPEFSNSRYAVYRVLYTF